MVICAEKSQPTLGLDRFVSHDTASRCLLHRRPQRGGLSKTVGAYPGGLSRRTLLHRLWGSLSKSSPVRTTHRVWQRGRANESHRTVEQHVTPTFGPLCPSDLIVFQIRDDARSLFALISSSLQSLVTSHLIYPLPEKEANQNRLSPPPLERV